MPRRKNKKHRRTKHRKSNSKTEPKQLNLDNKKKLIICKLLKNICKKDAGIKDIADLVLSTTLSDEELNDMIKTSWCDSTIDSKMTNFFIDVLVSVRNQRIGSSPDIAQITQRFTMSLFCVIIAPERKSYMNQCIVWSLDILTSIGITDMIPRSCDAIIKTSCLLTDNSLSDLNKCFLELIGHLFNNDQIDAAFIYNKILNKLKESSNQTIQMEMLYHISKICGYKLYAESSNRFNAIFDKYVKQYQDVECPRCMESFDTHPNKFDPVQTPCNHIYCRDCIQSCLQSQKKSEKVENCPLCKTAFNESELEFESVEFMVFKVLKMRKTLVSEDLNKDSSQGFGMAKYNIETNASNPSYNPIDITNPDSYDPLAHWGCLENASREEKSREVERMLRHLQKTLGWPKNEPQKGGNKCRPETHLGSLNEQNGNTNSNNATNHENNNDDTGLCENKIESVEETELKEDDTDNQSLFDEETTEGMDKSHGTVSYESWESKYMFSDKFNKTLKEKLKLLTDKHVETVRKSAATFGHLQSEIENLKQKHKKQTSEIQSLKLENSEMTERYNNLDMECDIFKNEAHKLEDGLLEKQNENVKLDERCKHLEDSLQQSVNKQKTIEQQYDKDKTQMQIKYNDAIAQTKLTQNKMNQLRVTYDELERKYSQQQQKFSYLFWDAQQIANWILNINKRKYKKYYNILIKNMTNEGINGQCLHELNRNDLHRFGITNFNDKCDILIGINELIRNNNVNKNQLVSTNEEKCGRCVVCLEGIPNYVCLPCGHLNVCGNCQSKLTGTCPMCQTKYKSLVKVFHDLQ